ncbi:MAG: type II toxin-antitoxin system RelE/ParE family toxin [Planctomycetota bacterium]
MTRWTDDWAPGASADYLEALQHYADIDPRLAVDLQRRVDDAIELLCRFPASAATIPWDARRKLIGRFPYGIVYREMPEIKQLRVLAFAHLERRPGYWAQRR